ncbi:MAG: type II toxin-antitoxin system Phd/YefM family antitoxin [Planctomycetes bacterium]|nr:type II toxin-antitoxin system Phd/YefM family antitoxin [Planctomycetota bacterium]
MRTVNIHEAKTHLSRLLARMSAGAEVVIAKAGKPLARLIPIRRAPRPRRLGVLAGRLTVPAGFDAPLPGDALDAFEGRG